MASLVLELQAEALNRRVPVSDLLRKALVFSKKLGVTQIEEWLSNELNGYGSDSEVPAYREIHGQIKVWNQFHGWQPLNFGDPKMAETLSVKKIMQPVGELDSLIDNKGDGVLEVPFPQHIVNMLMKGMDLPMQPILLVAPSEVVGILDVVRNNILNWALKLEEEGILGEGLSFSPEEKQKAKSATEINIQTFQGILGDVEGSIVTQNLHLNITQNDFHSLTKYLESKGVFTEDIVELKKAISSDTTPKSPDDFGEKTSGWIGKMVSKAASGAWKIGVGEAGGLLVKALSAYFGF